MIDWFGPPRSAGTVTIQQRPRHEQANIPVRVETMKVVGGLLKWMITTEMYPTGSFAVLSAYQGTTVTNNIAALILEPFLYPQSFK